MTIKNVYHKLRKHSKTVLKIKYQVSLRRKNCDIFVILNSFQNLIIMRLRRRFAPRNDKNKKAATQCCRNESGCGTLPSKRLSIVCERLVAHPATLIIKYQIGSPKPKCYSFFVKLFLQKKFSGCGTLPNKRLNIVCERLVAHPATLIIKYQIGSPKPKCYSFFVKLFLQKKFSGCGAAW